jgi:selenocysteine-specific elongation factor
MFVLGTAGHIDHGKSALVLALTGIDPDRLPEEKERGMTIDLGFAWLSLPDGSEVGIVNVPGHERFVKNMVAGVRSRGSQPRRKIRMGKGAQPTSSPQRGEENR